MQVRPSPSIVEFIAMACNLFRNMVHWINCSFFVPKIAGCIVFCTIYICICNV